MKKNIKVVYLLKQKYDIKMPILEAMYRVLVQNYSFDKAIKDLLSRPLSDD